MTREEREQALEWFKNRPITMSGAKKMYDLAISALAERKRGEWRELTNIHHTYICSVCGRMLVNIIDGKNNVAKNYPFCHCGADMRGEANE